jgi:hypothetical protein
VKILRNLFRRRPRIERYIVRNRGDWAFIYLDEERGVFTACSSYGDYAYIWSHRGSQSLKEFVRDLDFDYFMDKTRGAESKRFDFYATIKGMREFVADARRQRDISKEEAREAWTDLEELEGDHTDSADLFVDRVYASKAIGEAYGYDFEGVICNSANIQCKGFWEMIWPEFLKQLPA